MSESNFAPDTAFSPDELCRRCLENVELAKRVLRTFLAHGEQELVSLERFASAGQHDETAKVAHRLKGASDNAAAHRLCRLAASLEQSARHGAPDLAGQVSALRMEWGCFLALANEFLSPTQASLSISPSA